MNDDEKGDIKTQLKAEVNQAKAVVSSSTGDVQSLIEKSEKLKELISYLKKNVTNESQKSKWGLIENIWILIIILAEIDDILASIDNVSVVTKDEAGKNFYNELAQSIYQISRELLNRYHGIASLVDVFYITNEKRKICKNVILKFDSHFNKKKHWYHQMIYWKHVQSLNHWIYQLDFVKSIKA